MDQLLEAIPERRTSSQEDRDTYQTFLDSIEAGGCEVPELFIARDKTLINAKQCDSLVTLLVEKLKKEGRIDSLTKIFNRASLEPQLNRIIEELNREPKLGEVESKYDVQSVMVIYLDIDNFKILNDRYGRHEVGDKALIMVADRLKNATKRNDLIFRFAGDEFVAVLPISDKNQNDQSAKAIFDRIKAKINRDLSVDAGKGVIPFTVSMDYSVFMKGDEIITAKELINRADHKMYQIKEERKIDRSFL